MFESSDSGHEPDQHPYHARPPPPRSLRPRRPTPSGAPSSPPSSTASCARRAPSATVQRRPLGRAPSRARTAARAAAPSCSAPRPSSTRGPAGRASSPRPSPTAVATETDRSFFMTRTEVELRGLRRPPRPRLQRRTEPDRPALLHQHGVAEARPRGRGQGLIWVTRLTTGESQISAGWQHGPMADRPGDPVRTTAQLAGDSAETLVASRLTEAGWTVLARNVHVGRHELDLVAIDPGPPSRSSSSRSAGVAAATSACPRRRSIIASGRGSAPPPTACSIAGTLPDGEPVPRLPLRFDLIVVEPGDRLRHHRHAM